MPYKKAIFGTEKDIRGRRAARFKRIVFKLLTNCGASFIEQLKTNELKKCLFLFKAHSSVNTYVVCN